MFAFSGLWDHWESTLTGIIGLAATGGIITAGQAAGINTMITAVVAALTAIAAVLKLFYAGPAPTPPAS